MLLFGGARGTPGWTAKLEEDGRISLQVPDRELYDLASDPGERANLLDLEHPRPLRELWLEGKLASAVARHGGAVAAEEAEIDPELERSLRALGYLTATSTAPAGSGCLRWPPGSSRVSP